MSSLTLQELGDFFIKWFKGPVLSGNRDYKYTVFRELGVCDDMAIRAVFNRDSIIVEDLLKLLNRIVEVNVFLGVGFWLFVCDDEPKLTCMMYDRVSYDFDSKEDPGEAIKAAIHFSRLLEKEYNLTTIVYKSGFKGAHVVVPLSKPTDWMGYKLLWNHFYALAPSEYRPLIDRNMLQWNRLERVPFTFNIREGKRRLAEMIRPVSNPGDFDWSLIRGLNPEEVTVYISEFKKDFDFMTPRSRGKPRDDWITKIVEIGLPDGRHRFVHYVLAPRCVNVWMKSENECENIIHVFIENSCRHWNKCGSFSESDIRSYLRSAARRGFPGFTLRGLRNKDLELYDIIMSVLNSNYI